MEGAGPTLEALRANEDAAWQAAWPILWRTVLGVVRAKLHFPDSHDLENIAAEIIGEEIVPQVAKPTTKTFNQIQTFDDLLNVTKAIARNRVVDYIRSRIRRPEDRLGEDDNRGLPEPVEGGGPLPDFTLEELLGLVVELQPPDPDLFHDRFILGLTTVEIAKKRRMPPGTVLSRFRRAFFALRPKLERMQRTAEEPSHG